MSSIYKKEKLCRIGADLLRFRGRQFASAKFLDTAYYAHHCFKWEIYYNFFTSRNEFVDIMKFIS